MAVSHIMMESYKKFILLSLIVHGKVSRCLPYYVLCPNLLTYIVTSLFIFKIMFNFLLPSTTTQPALNDWCNKGYPVCGMVHIKEPLLAFRVVIYNISDTT